MGRKRTAFRYVHQPSILGYFPHARNRSSRAGPGSVPDELDVQPDAVRV
jgi:hypothetical protein